MHRYAKIDKKVHQKEIAVMRNRAIKLQLQGWKDNI